MSSSKDTQDVAKAQQNVGWATVPASAVRKTTCRLRVFQDRSSTKGWTKHRSDANKKLRTKKNWIESGHPLGGGVNEQAQAGILQVAHLSANASTHW